MRLRPTLVFRTFLLLAPVFAPLHGLRAQSTANYARPRITAQVDDTHLQRLTGSTHSSLAHADDLGQVDSALPMDRMQLVLRRSPEQQAALDELLASQIDPKSPGFHHWITPDEFGQRFGVADADLDVLTHWLTAEGFTVNAVSKGRLTVDFSGNADQVRRAFHTEVHSYRIKGALRFANQADPSIPEALAPVVVGIASLNNLQSKSQAIIGSKVTRDEATGKYKPAVSPLGLPLRSLPPLGSGGAAPQYTGTVQGDAADFLAPYDFATIYNELPLWNAGTNGSGVHVAIAGRSDVRLSDIAAFRSQFGLPVNPPTIIHNGTDPGVLDSTGDAGENTLDVEWSGASAPGAKIDLVVSASTNTTDGFNLSALYIIDNQVAPIMSSSYGSCELFLGTAGNSFFNSLWQQAAAEGISAFVSSGDQASAGCDDNSQNTPFYAVDGVQVNGIASPPYVTGVGGTDFGLAEFTSPTTYFNTSNTANGQSAKGYIPEVPWNNACTSNIVTNGLFGSPVTPEQSCNTIYSNYPSYDFLINTVGGSGGVSACTTPSGSTPASCSGGYAKPSWQTGPGVPADGKRDVPDISFFAASGEYDAAYLFYYEGALTYAGGTSISSPAMAGIMSLVVQNQGAPQGVANPVLYQLAAGQNTASCSSDTVAAGNSCVFYDTVSGNIAAPCQPGSPNCVTTTAGDVIGVQSGYTATAGYDSATGLGSANVTNLVNRWKTTVGTQAVAITVGPSNLPAGNQNTAYDQQIVAAGGVAPYVFAVTSGALPTGLSLSGTGFLTGVPTAIGTYTFTISATDRSVTGPYTGSTGYSVTIGPFIPASAFLNWLPARDNTYSGLTIGADVLNAIGTLPGTVAYTATLANSAPAVAVTSTTVLAPGMYTLTATYTSSVVGIPTTTLSIPFNVLLEYVWIANSAGDLYRLDAAGSFTYSLAGAGLGLAFDSGGAAWSATTNGTSVAAYPNSGAVSAPFGTASGGGLNGATAIALDGAGSVWVANSNSSVSQFTNLGVPISPSTGYTGGALSTPSGIAIDISGNVWISNSGSNSVTEILGGAVPVQPLTRAVQLGTPAVKP